MLIPSTTGVTGLCAQEMIQLLDASHTEAPTRALAAAAATAGPAGDESKAKELAWLAAPHRRLGPLGTPHVRLSRQFTSSLHSITIR
jgi:hypothetical protein